MRRYRERVENSGSIPIELMQFVKKDSYSLVIKGAAGTGKTTLCLTILRALDIKDNFFYICTRVSPRQLLASYPWISKFKDIQTEITPKSATGEADVPLNFEDARLDEPESLFERITNELMDVKAPLIVIDSWDAVASFMDREARLNNERVLQTWRERAGAKLIFINEDPVDASLDFVVDGAVKLEQVVYEDVRMREISFLKLRGIKISKPSYLFTLDKGNFRSFQTYNPKNFIINRDLINSLHTDKKKSQVLILHDHRIIKSGYNELDANLNGGFPRGGIAAIEIEPAVRIEVAMAFLFRIILNFLKSGNVVYFEPPESVDPVSLNLYLKSYLSMLQHDKHKLFWLGGQIKSSEQFSTSADIKDAGILGNLKSVVEERQPKTNRFLLNILSLTRLQELNCRKKTEYLSFARQNIDLTILVAWRNESIQLDSGNFDVALKITVLKGSLFLRILYPLSPILALEVNNSLGYPVLKVIPSV